MEFGFTCKLCGFHESWDHPRACGLAAARHLFEEHQEGELPLEHPEDFGQRFQEWESQL
jgi:hypothetical protein